MDKLDKLKWQIHAETSASQLTHWVIIIAVVHSPIAYIIGGIFIIGNFYTMIKASIKLGSKYFE